MEELSSFGENCGVVGFNLTSKWFTPILLDGNSTSCTTELRGPQNYSNELAIRTPLANVARQPILVKITGQNLNCNPADGGIRLVGDTGQCILTEVTEPNFCYFICMCSACKAIYLYPIAPSEVCEIEFL